MREGRSRSESSTLVSKLKYRLLTLYFRSQWHRYNLLHLGLQMSKLCESKFRKGGSRGLNYKQYKNGEIKLTPQEMRQQIIEICYEEHTLRYLGALEFKTQ